MSEQLQLFDVRYVEPRWVYVMARVGPGGLLYKIGQSTHPYRRARQLNSRIVTMLPGNAQLERQLHHRFRAYRLPGTEWFWPGPLLRSWLEIQRAQWN